MWPVHIETIDYSPSGYVEFSTCICRLQMYARLAGTLYVTGVNMSCWMSSGNDDPAIVYILQYCVLSTHGCYNMYF